MKTHQSRGALLGSLILSLVSSGLQGQETSPAPQPKERPASPAAEQEGPRGERIRQRIRDLRAAGKHEEAAQMVERMRQAHTKRVPNHTADKTPRGGADQAGGRKAARKEDRKAHAGHPGRKEAPQPTEPPTAMKIRNLNMAAGLLEAAGYRDFALRTRQEAGRIEGETRKAMEMKDRPGPADGMRDDMRKLRREVEELRGQLNKVKAEAQSRPDRGRREGYPPR